MSLPVMLATIAGALGSSVDGMLRDAGVPIGHRPTPPARDLASDRAAIDRAEAKRRRRAERNLRKRGST